MTRWIVSTPVADFLLEAEDGIVTATPRMIAELCGLPIEKAKDICASLGWGIDPA